MQRDDQGRWRVRLPTHEAAEAAVAAGAVLAGALDLPRLDPESSLKTVLVSTNYLFTALFVCEMLIKIKRGWELPETAAVPEHHVVRVAVVVLR